MLHYLHSHVMTHREKRRLWIEGVRPATAGFVPGARYNRRCFGKRVILELHPEGEFKVSRRLQAGTYLPVMDVKLTTESQLQEGERIRAVFQKGVIMVTIHHEAEAKAERESRFFRNLSQGQITEGSACTGGGISTAATHEAVASAGLNGQLAFVIDEELKYLQIAGVNNFAINDDTAFFVSKIEEIETESYIPKVDLLSFSLPCSNHSKAGKSKHKQRPEEHPSATSLFGIINVIKASNPAIIWSENVPEARNSSIYILLKNELIRRGYRIIEDVTGNEKTGSLECRTRYWFMAISDGIPNIEHQVFDYLLPKRHDSISQIRDYKADAIEGNWSDNTYLKEKQIRDRKQGKGFSFRTLMTGHENQIGVIAKHYNKRRSTEPMWIRGSDGKERLMTPKEHAAVKQVPFQLVANVCPTVSHEILGQGVDYMQSYMPILRLMRNAAELINYKNSA